MKKLIALIVILHLNVFNSFTQEVDTTKADTYFENLSYVKASVEYEKLAESNASSHILQRLGDCYYLNVQMNKAVVVYERLFDLYTPTNPEYYFKYAQSLRAVGQFDASKKWMKRFNKVKKEDSRGKNFTDSAARLAELKNNKPEYLVRNLYAINTEFSDFGVTENGGSIIFSSPRKDASIVKRLHARNQRKFLDLYTVSKYNLNTTGKSIPEFSKEINSIYHESSVAFSPDRRTIYFTRNNFNKSFKTDDLGYNNLKIFKAELINGKWRNIEELPFCSDDYSVGHPTISADGRRLYFISDMPGGFGETDIYMVEMHQGVYGNPKNLGPKINTEGREMFPFIANDNTLYFSSDGHFGIGALDIFESKQVNGKYQTPENMKSPINSKLDDFAFSFNPITQKGFLSSNREGGLGDDDIYSFEKLEVPESEECMQTVTGTVRNVRLKKYLPHARLVIRDENNQIIKDTVADEFGRFSFVYPCNNYYMITGSKEYYQPDSKNFNTKNPAVVNLNLKINDDFVYTPENELIIKIKTIYFDYDKWNIRPDAAVELDHIVEIMEKYPKLKVKATSHTDARGFFRYNEWLSQQRAESTVDYLIYNGINPNRISAKGYGEYRLTNNCYDNDFHTNTVKCTEPQHQANRRTAFVILNVDGTEIKSEDNRFYNRKTRYNQWR